MRTVFPLMLWSVIGVGPPRLPAATTRPLPAPDHIVYIFVIKPFILTSPVRNDAQSNRAKSLDRIELFRTFARVVECASFTRAADTLELPRSSVSAAVIDLEARVGARLLH